MRKFFRRNRTPVEYKPIVTIACIKADGTEIFHAIHSHV